MGCELRERTCVRLDGKQRRFDADPYNGNTDGELPLAIGWDF